MISKIRKIQEILKTVSDNVWHYEAMKKDGNYIVWEEDAEGNRISADNKKSESSIQGTIDYFTKEDMDPMVDRIYNALREAGIAFYLNSVQYEDETGYIHYEYVWEVS